jgi:hypothetical protein
LTPKAFHFRNGQTLYSNLSKCLANVIELEGLDNRHNDFHKDLLKKLGSNFDGSGKTRKFWVELVKYHQYMHHIGALR